MGLDVLIFVRNRSSGWRETAKIGAFCALNGCFLPQFAQLPAKNCSMLNNLKHLYVYCADQAWFQYAR